MKLVSKEKLSDDINDVNVLNDMVSFENIENGDGFIAVHNASESFQTFLKIKPENVVRWYNFKRKKSIRQKYRQIMK